MATAAAADAPFPLTDTDRWALAQPDEAFELLDWAGVKSIVENNDLAALRRKPSDLRRYMKWTADTNAAYGSITNYLLAHRLPPVWGHPPFVPAAAVPFEDPSDFSVLRNEWPYGLTPDITHIVVWTRTIIPTDPDTGDLTPQSRALVATFVQRFFADRLAQDGKGNGDGDDRVLWFKNWAQLQSVRQLDHVHVLVRNASPLQLQSWTVVLPCHQVRGDERA